MEITGVEIARVDADNNTHAEYIRTTGEWTTQKHKLGGLYSCSLNVPYFYASKSRGGSPLHETLRSLLVPLGDFTVANTPFVMEIHDVDFYTIKGIASTSRTPTMPTNTGSGAYCYPNLAAVRSAYMQRSITEEPSTVYLAGVTYNKKPQSFAVYDDGCRSHVIVEDLTDDVYDFVKKTLDTQYDYQTSGSIDTLLSLI